MFNGLLVSLQMYVKFKSKFLFVRHLLADRKFCDLKIFVLRLFGCLLHCVYWRYEIQRVMKLMFAVS